MQTTQLKQKVLFIFIVEVQTCNAYTCTKICKIVKFCVKNLKRLHCKKYTIL